MLGLAAAGAWQPLSAWAQAKEPNSDKKEAPAEVLRKEVAEPLQAAQALLREGKGAEAVSKIKQAEAIPSLSPYETYIIQRLRGAAAVSTGDTATALASLSAAVASGRAQGAELQALLQSLTGLAQQANDGPGTIRWAREYLKAGGSDDSVRLALVRAFLMAGDCAAVLSEVKVLLDQSVAAGRKPNEDQLRIQANCQGKLKDIPGYTASLEQLVLHHPKADYWADLLGRVLRRSGFPERLYLDVYRLMRQVGVLDDADDSIYAAELALKAGLPGEAQAVLEQGFAQGVLGKGSAAASHKDLLARATKLAKDDKASLADGEAQALKSADGARLFALGEALLSYGQLDKGLALMQQGLSKGIARQPDDARLRYGAALLQAGQRSEGQAALDPLKGKDALGDLARLWMLATRP